MNPFMIYWFCILRVLNLMSCLSLFTFRSCFLCLKKNIYITISFSNLTMMYCTEGVLSLSVSLLWDIMRILALLLGVKAACVLLVSSLSGTGAVNNSGRWWWVNMWCIHSIPPIHIARLSVPLHSTPAMCQMRLLCACGWLWLFCANQLN